MEKSSLLYRIMGVVVGLIFFLVGLDALNSGVLAHQCRRGGTYTTNQGQKVCLREALQCLRDHAKPQAQHTCLARLPLASSAWGVASYTSTGPLVRWGGVMSVILGLMCMAHACANQTRWYRLVMKVSILLSIVGLFLFIWLGP